MWVFLLRYPLWTLFVSVARLSCNASVFVGDVVVGIADQNFFRTILWVMSVGGWLYKYRIIERLLLEVLVSVIIYLVGRFSSRL